MSNKKLLQAKSVYGIISRCYSGSLCNAKEQHVDRRVRINNEKWRYLKVPQQEFEKLHPDSFGELCIAFDR